MPPPGVSYGLTQQLYNFWRKAGYEPLYLRQSTSDTTGEHTCIMVRPLEHPDVGPSQAAAGGPAVWLAPFVADFKARFMALLSGPAFRGMAPALALSVLDPRLDWPEAEAQRSAEDGSAPGAVLRGDGTPLDPYDLKRLQVADRKSVV